MNNRRLNWLICISSVCLITTFTFYKCAFPGGFVYTRGDWGTFGDFFGGVLNPILALINIIMLAYITKAVADLDEGRHEDSLTIEKDRFEKSLEIDRERHSQSLELQKEAALYGLKQSALTEVVAILNEIYEEAADQNNTSIDKLAKSRNKLNTFLSVHSNLFPRFNTAKEEFKPSIQALINLALRHTQDRIAGGPDASQISKDLGDTLSNFLDSMEDLITGAQRDLNL